MNYNIEWNQYNGINNETVFLQRSNSDNCILSAETNSIFIGETVEDALFELKSKIPTVNMVNQAVPSVNISDTGLITATSVQQEGNVGSGIKSVEMQLPLATSPEISIAVGNNGLISATSLQNEGFIGEEITKQTTKQITPVAISAPTITVNNSGLITASVSQSSGYLLSETKSTTKQLSTKATETYVPKTYNQTISSGVYLTGNQIIQGSSNLIPSNIKNGVSIFGVTGTMSSENSFQVDSLTLRIKNNFSSKTTHESISCFYLDTDSKSGDKWVFGEVGPIIETHDIIRGNSVTITIPYQSCLYFTAFGYNVSNYRMGYAQSGGLVKQAIYLAPYTIKFITNPNVSYAEFTFYEQLAPD